MATRTISQQIDLTNQAEPVNRYITKIDSDGIKIHPEDQSNNDYIQLDGNGLEVYKNNISVANFTSSGARIGLNNGYRTEINDTSIEMIDMNDQSFFKVLDRRNNTGYATITQSWVGGGYTEYTVTIDGWEENDTPIVKVGGVETDNYTQFKYLSTKYNSIRFSNPPNQSVEITYRTNTSIVKSFTLGKRKINTTEGALSYSEGDNNQASGNFSHAEGSNVDAIGDYSHSEGYYTWTKGKYAHAQNEHTIARYDSQTAIGKWNTDSYSSGESSNIGFDNSYFAFVIGNGDDTERSDAFAVTWDGDVCAANNLYLQGDIEVNGDITDGNGNVLSDKADVSAIPTKTSDLTNNSNFVTLTNSKPLFKKVSVQKTFSISAGSTANQSFAPASADVPSGYTRVGLCSWNTANGNVFIVTCTGTTITFGNKSSSSVTCTNAQVDWLFIRSSV